MHYKLVPKHSHHDISRLAQGPNITLKTSLFDWDNINCTYISNMKRRSLKNLKTCCLNKIKTVIRISFIAVFVAIGCTSSDSKNKISAQTDSTLEDKGLKDYYKGYFPVGVAVSPKALKAESEATLIKKHFMSMTAENVMKMGPIHPEENKYNWVPADEIVAFAEENKLMLRGHALCWHRQYPDWMFIGKDGKQVSKEVLLKRLATHIEEVAGRYKDKIFAWDVVNEAISDRPDEFYRNSTWFQICGEDYIIKAFESARKAAPNAKLFYNDYNVIDAAKRKKIIQLVKTLREKGVPIDGIGIQGHWSVFEPSENQLRATFDSFSSLPVELHITELDVSIYKKEHARSDRKKTDAGVLTPELALMQSEKYKMIFSVFRDYKDELSSLTFWNISDRRSWLDNFPVRNRKDFPLLFDQNEVPKDAYWEVINF